MFELEQIVVHPTAGVCKIESIENKMFSRTDVRKYFVLKNIFETNNTTIYLPVDCNKVGVRQLYTKKQITDLIKSVDFSESLWIENDNARQEAFYNILKSGALSKIIQLIVELHHKESERLNIGKNLRVADAKKLKEATKTVYEEIAYVFEIDICEVPKFISKQLNIDYYVYEKE